MRLAHLSDLHFAHFTWDLKQFFCKRWIGNWNSLLFRRFQYTTRPLLQLPELLNRLAVTHLCITGDLSTTGLDAEFAEARAFITQCTQRAIQVYTLPGNHDIYVKGCRERYYHFFPDPALENTRVVAHPLGGRWWWVGLDCACCTGWGKAYGQFTPQQACRLEQILETLSPLACVVLANHFPLYASTGGPHHDLQGREHLQRVLRAFPKVKLYLHGHDHRPYYVDERAQGFPLVVNTGSSARRHGGLCHILDLQGASFDITKCVL